MELQDLNIVVIGAGVGGLAAGALLARKGAMVTVLEAQDYPGGCAATFSRNGYRFDAGATDRLRVSCRSSDGDSRQRAWYYLAGFAGTGCLAVPSSALHLDLPPNRLEILERFPRSAPFWAEQASLAKLLWRFPTAAFPGRSRERVILSLLPVKVLPDCPEQRTC